MDTLPLHGTRNRYNRGCRCAPCTEAKRVSSLEYATAYRAKHGISPTTAGRRRRGLSRPHQKRTIPCSHCLNPFTQNHPSALYCSGNCRRRACESRQRVIRQEDRSRPVSRPLRLRALKSSLYRRSWGRGVYRGVYCITCGQPFVTRHFGVLHCSEDCGKIRRRRAKQLQNDVRRARERDAFVAHVYRQEVFERDQYICHLCGIPCDRDAVVPDWLAPTLDHVIPLALGGMHEPGNCRTAHFVCNARKGATEVSELPSPAMQLQLTD